MKSIAIIIPVYNTPINLIDKCINSCLEQSHQSIQIVVIDDGSTHKETVAALENYKNTYPTKINLYRIPNGGASLARKHGLEQCKTDFIFFLDADDYMENNCLDSLSDLQKEDNADVVIGQYNIISKNNIVPGTKFKLLAGTQSVVRSFLTGDLPGTLWPNLYKKELFENITFYNYSVGEDLVINSQIFTKENLKVAISTDVVYNYFRHDESLTKVVSEEKTNLGYLATWKNLEIIKSKTDSAGLQFEISINKLNTLYALLVLSSNKCEEMISKLKETNKNILKAAIHTFPIPKKFIFLIALNIPFSSHLLKFVIKLLRNFKSN